MRGHKTKPYKGKGKECFGGAAAFVLIVIVAILLCCQFNTPVRSEKPESAAAQPSLMEDLPKNVYAQLRRMEGEG